MTESPIKEVSQEEGPKSPKKTMKGAFRGMSAKKSDSVQSSPKSNKGNSPKKKKGGGILTVLKTKRAATLFLKSLKKLFVPGALMRFIKVKKIAGNWKSKPKPKPAALAPKTLADVIKAQKMKKMAGTWKSAKKKFKTFTDLMGAIKVKTAVVTWKGAFAKRVKFMLTPFSNMFKTRVIARKWKWSKKKKKNNVDLLVRTVMMKSKLRKWKKATTLIFLPRSIGTIIKIKGMVGNWKTKNVLSKYFRRGPFPVLRIAKLKTRLGKWKKMSNIASFFVPRSLFRLVGIKSKAQKWRQFNAIKKGLRNGAKIHMGVAGVDAVKAFQDEIDKKTGLSKKDSQQSQEQGSRRESKQGGVESRRESRQGQKGGGVGGGVDGKQDAFFEDMSRKESMAGDESQEGGGTGVGGIGFGDAVSTAGNVDSILRKSALGGGKSAVSGGESGGGGNIEGRLGNGVRTAEQVRLEKKDPKVIRAERLEKLQKELIEAEELMKESVKQKESAEKKLEKIKPFYKVALDESRLKSTVVNWIKSIRFNPPPVLRVLLEAICVLKGIKPYIKYKYGTNEIDYVDFWLPSKKLLGGNFLEELNDLRRLGVQKLPYLQEFVAYVLTNPDFTRVKIERAFPPGLYDWIMCVYDLGNVSLKYEKKLSTVKNAQDNYDKGLLASNILKNEIETINKQIEREVKWDNRDHFTTKLTLKESKDTYSFTVKGSKKRRYE